MFQLRPSSSRGHANHGWLNSRHTFSFAEYYDPAHMGVGPLRVINDDRVAAGRGFGSHPHRDMDIISYVVEGALEHKDSMGTGSVIAAGDVQRMSAGTGVSHSEYNHSKTEGVHFLQIWITPQKRNLPPSYAQKFFGTARQDALHLVASQTGEGDSLTLSQDVRLYASELSQDKSVTVTLGEGRQGWLQMVSGTLEVSGQSGKAQTLLEGDGLLIVDETQLVFKAQPGNAHFLFFDLRKDPS